MRLIIRQQSPSVPNAQQRNDPGGAGEAVRVQQVRTVVLATRGTDPAPAVRVRSGAPVLLSDVSV